MVIMVDNVKKSSSPKSEVKTDDKGSKSEKSNINNKEETGKPKKKKYSRGEGQKPVNRNYRVNWEKIFRVKGDM